MNVTRGELYALVWAEPMTKVSARFSVSGSYLARVCRQLNVPCPERGYWAKLAVGKAPSPTALPEARPGDEMEWTPGKVDVLPRRASRRPERIAPVVPAESPDGQSRKPVRGTHPLLRDVEPHFEKVRNSDIGYLKPYKRNVVDLFVTRGQLRRSIKVASALFQTLHARGHRVCLSPGDRHYHRPALDERVEKKPQRSWFSSAWEPGRPTLTFVGTVAVGVSVFESSRKTPSQYIDGKRVPMTDSQAESLRRRGAWVSTDDLPSGMLGVRIYSPYGNTTWHRYLLEEDRSRQDEWVASLVRAIELGAHEIAREHEESVRKAEIERQRYEAEQARWKREEERRRRAKNLEDSRKQLVDLIEAWRFATDVRNFFDEIARSLDSLSEADRAGLESRLQAARAFVGSDEAHVWFDHWRSPVERDESSNGTP